MNHDVEATQNEVCGMSSESSGIQTYIHATMITLTVDVRTSEAVAPTYFMVPYEKNEFFVGQDDLIDQIFDRLCASKPHQYNHRIALYGMGGVGKTQTALAYVHTLKAELSLCLLD